MLQRFTIEFENNYQFQGRFLRPLIRDNHNYTEFIALKKNAKTPYFQGFPSVSKNQEMKNYTELNNYTSEPCFYAVLNMKMRIIIDLAPLGQ